MLPLSSASLLDAYARAAKSDRRDLAYRLVPQGSRNIEGCKEISGPDRLRARSPGFDPITRFRSSDVTEAQTENSPERHRYGDSQKTGMSLSINC